LQTSARLAVLLAASTRVQGYALAHGARDTALLSTRRSIVALAAEDANRDVEALAAEAQALRTQIGSADGGTPDGLESRSRLQQALFQAVEAMKETGLSDDEIVDMVTGDMAAETTEAAGTRPGSCPAPPAPTRGDEAWGRWSHSPAAMYLELFLEEGISARKLSVEIAEGWLFVSGSGGIDASDEPGAPPPLLFGRLAQPVLVDEMSWAVDEDSGGNRVLCVELPKKQSEMAATADCWFDETLQINGEPALVAGLSHGTITITLPKGLDQ